MIYIDIIATDEKDSFEIKGKKDHKWLGFQDGLRKPKVGLWQLWNIKKFIEKAYEKLERERTITKELQDSAGSSKGEVVGRGKHNATSSGKPKSKLGTDKR